MSISPNLFDDILPPEMWVTLGPVEPAYSDTRAIVVRIKPFGKRSVTVRESCSRYSPEVSVFEAIKHFVEECHSAQAALPRAQLQEILTRNVIGYVEPF